MPRLFICLFFLALTISTVAQKTVTLSGFIEDGRSGEALPNATLLGVGKKIGIVANKYGFFSITLPPGEYALEAGYVGYEPYPFSIRLERDSSLTISLFPNTLLEEVRVKRSTSFVSSTSVGKHAVSMEQIKNMPSILGEADVLRALQHLPGVNGGSEAMTGFSVRGGSPEQTQILLDGVPVYNVSHVFGYLSVFNGDALKEVSLLKSGIPARYGGRLSSVLDISMREGSSRDWGGKIALSPLAGSFTLEGPLKQEEASFIVAGRWSWIEGPVRLIQKIINNRGRIAYGFYDINAKLNWKLNSVNRFYFSFYTGNDAYTIQWGKNDGQYRYSWGNITLSGRWSRLVSARTFSNTTLYYSRFKYRNLYEYQYDIAEKEKAETTSHLEEITLKTDIDTYLQETHHLRYGGLLSRRHYAPEMSLLSVNGGGSEMKDATQGVLWSVEGYVEDDWVVHPAWRINGGVRLTLLFAENKNYFSLEPRLSVVHLLNENSSLKASWSRMEQPIHLLANSAQAWKTDMWVPVTDSICPGRSHLFSLGYYRTLRSGLAFSAEVYYNRLSRVVRYASGVNYLKRKDSSWQEFVYVGKGRGYGLDLMLSKDLGRLNGWISYSLSKSERSFDEIGHGVWFPFEYDRRHKLNLVANYTIPGNPSRRFTQIVAANFTYSSGNYTTISAQVYPGYQLPGDVSGWVSRDEWNQKDYIPTPNNARLPAYHRLDLAWHLKSKNRKGSSWSFGVYNVYNRQNPSFYYWNDDSIEKHRNGYRQVSITPVIPYFSWIYTL